MQLDDKPHLANLLELVVVLEEEGQVLVRHVDIHVGTELPQLGQRLGCAGEGVVLDLQRGAEQAVRYIRHMPYRQSARACR